MGTALCLFRAVSCRRGQRRRLALAHATNRSVIPILRLGECSSGICDEASCINGGTCTADRADAYICLCPLGFKGRHCEDGEEEASLMMSSVCMLIHVDVIFHLCTFSEAPYIFMALTLLVWRDRRIFFFFFLLVWSVFKYQNVEPVKDMFISRCSWARL